MITQASRNPVRLSLLICFDATTEWPLHKSIPGSMLQKQYDGREQKNCPENKSTRVSHFAQSIATISRNPLENSSSIIFRTRGMFSEWRKSKKMIVSCVNDLEKDGTLEISVQKSFWDQQDKEMECTIWHPKPSKTLVAIIYFSRFTCCFGKFGGGVLIFCNENTKFTESLVCARFTLFTGECNHLRQMVLANAPPFTRLFVNYR